MAKRDAASFEDLRLNDALLRNLKRLHFETPSEVQAKCIPEILDGRDVLGVANTGSGKTAAFALPILHLLTKDPYGVFALCLSPTRELAYQIAEQFTAFSAGMTLSCEVIIGGEDTIRQAACLISRPNIVIATPGRLMEHFMQSRDIVRCFSKIRFLILDEADRLLDCSFSSEMRYVLSKLPQKRQTLMLSATITKSVAALHCMVGEDAFYYEDTAAGKTASGCVQLYCFMPERLKDVYIVKLLRTLVALESSRAIVFCGTVQRCELLTQMLCTLDMQAASLHAAKRQKERIDTLNSFRGGLVQILVGTDVAARGLDLPAIDLVVNYDVPTDARQYVHRIGRTARFHATGKAVTMVTQYDVAKIKNIEQTIGKQLEHFDLQELDEAKLVGEVFAAKRVAKLQMASPGGFDEKLRAKKRRLERTY